MDCSAVEQSLSLLVDGELDSGTRLAVDVHLRQCLACEAQRRKLLKIKRCLGRSKAQRRAPDDFSEVLQSKLHRLECRTMPFDARAATKARKTVMITALGVALLMTASLLAILLWTRRLPDQVGAWTASQPRGVSLDDVALSSSLPMAAAPAFLAQDFQPRTTSSASIISLASRVNPDQKSWTSVAY